MFEYSPITPYLSVFGPNAEKYGQEKLRIRTILRSVSNHCLNIAIKKLPNYLTEIMYH